MTLPRLQLEETILATRDWLISRDGITVPFELKRRDPETPGRRRKEKLEDKIYAVTIRYFRRQKKKVRETLERWYPDRKAIAPPVTIWDPLFADDDIQRELLILLTMGAQDGVLLFSEFVTLGIDYTLVNTQAAKWARQHVGGLIDGINETTLNGVREAIAGFIETPGMTIGDVMRLLPFDENRAMMIAVTETTDAYSSAEQLAGEQMQKEFPDVQVVKTWFTYVDDRVCQICGPLHKVAVPIDKSFIGGDGNAYNKPPAHVRCRCDVSSRTDITGTVLERRKPMEDPTTWENPYV